MRLALIDVNLVEPNDRYAGKISRASLDQKTMTFPATHVIIVPVLVIWHTGEEELGLVRRR